MAGALFAVAIVLSWHPRYMDEAFSYTRLASPLIVLLAVHWLEEREWRWIAPLMLTSPRLLMELSSQVWRVLWAAL